MNLNLPKQEDDPAFNPPEQDKDLIVRLYYDTREEVVEAEDGNVYFNCTKCLEELPRNTSPKEYARQQLSITKEGLQLWCNRHDMNIALIRLRAARRKV